MKSEAKPMEQELSFIGIILLNIVAWILCDNTLIGLGFYFVFTIFCIAIIKYYIDYSRLE